MSHKLRNSTVFFISIYREKKTWMRTHTHTIFSIYFFLSKYVFWLFFVFLKCHLHENKYKNAEIFRNIRLSIKALLVMKWGSKNVSVTKSFQIRINCLFSTPYSHKLNNDWELSSYLHKIKFKSVKLLNHQKYADVGRLRLNFCTKCQKLKKNMNLSVFTTSMRCIYEFVIQCATLSANCN